MSDSLFVCGCGCKHIGDNCPQCSDKVFDGRNCKECGGRMEGNGVTEVLHCEHVYIGIDVAPDHDPIFCTAEDHGFYDEELDLILEMDRYTEEKWDEIRKQEKETRENEELREKIKRFFNSGLKEPVVAWCDYCNSFKKIFTRVSMGDNQEHLYCEGCTKDIFWFAFPPEDNPTSTEPSVCSCCGSTKTTDFPVWKEGKVVPYCLPCYRFDYFKHPNADDELPF